MPIKWKTNKQRKLNPQVILDKIESIKTVSEDGKVSYSSFEYHDAYAAIFSMLKIPKAIKNELNVQSLVARGLSQAAREGKITSDSVIKRISEIANNELAQKETKFYLLTSLSIDKPYPFKKIEINDCKIRITGSSYPKKYDTRTNRVNNEITNLSHEHHGYAKVIVTVKSKSEHGAASKALNSLDLLRSGFSLFVNPIMELLSDSRKPINKVRLGEVHTVHRTNGAVLNNGIWYEPNFVESKCYNSKSPKILKKNLKWFISQIEMCPYNSAVKEALLRYTRAFDERDQNSAAIRMWGALEALTSPNGANYDLIVKRCSFLLDETNYHRQILEHLREFRNQSVHAGDDSDRAKTYSYQMQYYFRELVLFHLFNAGNFESLDVANSLLDLPIDKSSLLKKRDLIDKALKYREKDA